MFHGFLQQKWGNDGHKWSYSAATGMFSDNDFNKGDIHQKKYVEKGIAQNKCAGACVCVYIYIYIYVYMCVLYIHICTHDMCIYLYTHIKKHWLMGIPAKIDPVFLDQPRRMGNAQRISVAITHLVPLCAEPARLPPWF